MKSILHIAAGVQIIASLLGFVAVAGHAEEVNDLKAVVSWSGHGQLMQTDTDEQEFLGKLNGVFYIETSEGMLNEAFIECAARQKLNRGEGVTHLAGKCTLIQSEDDSVFASFDCRGQPGACKGEFSLNGGAGAFEGISGTSSLIMRSPLRHVATSMTSVEELVVRHGVMVLPDLGYSIEGELK